jgi:hypothetical protein
MHVAFQVPYMYDYMTLLCRRQAEIIQNTKNKNVRNMDKTKPHSENIRGLNLVEVTFTTVQVS